MKKIFSQNGKTLLHIICRRDDLEIIQKDQFGRVDVAPDDQFLQVAALQLNEGKTFKPHKHIFKEGSKEVIAQESWVVIKGSVKAILYDLEDQIVSEEILNEGDLSMTFRGGHNYIALSANTFVYEFKTGPYLGQALDKKFIE